MTGVPAAMASANGIPNPSYRERNIIATAPLNRRISCAVPTKPRQTTLGNSDAGRVELPLACARDDHAKVRHNSLQLSGRAQDKIAALSPGKPTDHNNIPSTVVPNWLNLGRRVEECAIHAITHDRNPFVLRAKQFDQATARELRGREDAVRPLNDRPEHRCPAPTERLMPRRHRPRQVRLEGMEVMDRYGQPRPPHGDIGLGRRVDPVSAPAPMIKFWGVQTLPHRLEPSPAQRQAARGDTGQRVLRGDPPRLIQLTSRRDHSHFHARRARQPLHHLDHMVPHAGGVARAVQMRIRRYSHGQSAVGVTARTSGPPPGR